LFNFKKRHLFLPRYLKFYACLEKSNFTYELPLGFQYWNAGLLARNQSSKLPRENLKSH